jgi:hypothetical protein
MHAEFFCHDLPAEQRVACVRVKPHCAHRLTFRAPVQAEGTKAFLRAKLPEAGEEAVDLLFRLLAERPSERLSVEEALAHPFFDLLPSKAPQVRPVAGCTVRVRAVVAKDLQLERA